VSAAAVDLSPRSLPAPEAQVDTYSQINVLFGARCPLCQDHPIVAAGCGSADEAAETLERHVATAHGGWR
jgi:hypothetical protein